MKQPHAYLPFKPLLLIGLIAGAFCGTPSATYAAAPSISKITLLPTRQLELQMGVDIGGSYIFEVSTNMVHWMAVGGINNAPSTTVTVVDESTVDLAPTLFFRLKVGRYTQFSLGFMHFVEAGQFQAGSTAASLSLPSTFKGYSAWFEAEGDQPWPALDTVLFTGPAGSNLSAVPASPEHSNTDEGWYMTDPVPAPFGAPQGSWVVNYRGANQTFTSNLDMLSHLVMPVPTVVVSGGLLQSVSWVYRDRVSGALLGAAPSYVRQIMVQVDGSAGRLYDSPDGGSPALTSHTLLKQVSWSDVRTVTLAYDDDLSNHFVLFYQVR